MKVFINFGDIRCVVPVGDGTLTVKDVIDLAVERYKKAISKPVNSKITVHTLKTCRDGAILDPDDVLNDVADDREQLTALFKEDTLDEASHYYSKSTKPNGFYGQLNLPPTRSFPTTTTTANGTIKTNVNDDSRHNPPQNSLHSMNHYNHLTADGIYARNISAALSNGNSSTAYSMTYQRNHHRSDSISDSLLSSNESPDVFQQDTITEDTYFEHLNDRSDSYSYRDSFQPNKSNLSKSSMNESNPNSGQSAECQNTSLVSRSIPINNSRRADMFLSRSYDAKLCDTLITTESRDDVVEITADQINSYANMPTLHVRHGSEPTLNSGSTTNAKAEQSLHDSLSNQNSRFDISACSYSKSNDLFDDQTAKRWSTAIAVDNCVQSKLLPVSKPNTLDANYEHSDEEKSFNSTSPQSNKEEGYASEERPSSQLEPTQPPSPPNATSPQTFVRFTRGSGRLSMINNNLEAWADAADRQLLRMQTSDSKSNEGTNRDRIVPFEQHKSDHYHNTRHHQVKQNHNQIYDSSLGSMSSSSQENENLPRFSFDQYADNATRAASSTTEISVIIDLAKESGPLGIHVLPDSSNGPNSVLKQGLLIQGIEPGGRIDRDGRLHVGDTIVEIDHQKFEGLNFEKAQEIFRSSLQNDRIKLRIIKSSTSSYSNCDTSDNSLLLSSAEPNHQLESSFDHRNESSLSIEYKDVKDKEILVEGEERAGQQTKLATVTTTRKHSTGIIGYKPPASAIVMANTRRIGKKYHIQLKKGMHGLGFTITTRDNPAGGHSPIYIKTILPRGAAVQDGRLKPGDRMLEVCGIEMTGKSQEEAVKILRNLPLDSIVDIIVSRQEVEMSPSPLMPRQLPPEKVNEPNCSSSNEREVMTFKIPLNDTGSAGLGVSVKGKTSSVDGKQMDLGIFVKSVIHGGAASKDGRLRQDDQLININGIPLSGKTNSEAMETLRRAMIKSADAITLSIARRVCRSPTHCTETNSNVSYRHQHETSILSNESYDMSFNNQLHDFSIDGTGNSIYATSPYKLSPNDSGCHEEDSYRSSDNTVIYNASSQLNRLNISDNQSPSNNENFQDQIVLGRSLNDSELSLNDSQACAAERFRRDGFGRQSMSEKRHAQLDAKNTDTYRRNKKNRDDIQQELSDGSQIQDLEKSIPKSSDIPPSMTQINSASYGEDEQAEDIVPVQRINLSPDVNESNKPSATTGKSMATPKAKSPNKNQMLFSPTCCWKCQSPGSCPCRSKSELSTDFIDHRRNGLYVKNTNLKQSSFTPTKEQVASAFGLRKSCSLESLQTLMQDLQKEQVERVGGNVPGFSGARHGTVRVGRSRETNESFRVAVDRSYDMKNFINHANMDSVEEECDSHEEMMSRHSTCPYRVGGGHSMTSTNFTTTTNLTATTTDDDNAQLIKSKKKKGIFKNLFHFGSRKGRSKSVSSDPNESHKISDTQISDEAIFQSSDINRKYQIEQEKINMQYRKLLEQQKQKQQFAYARNQLHPMHSSMPMSNSYRSKCGVNTNGDPLIGSPSHNPLQLSHSTSQQYGSKLVHRDTVGVPHIKNDKMNPYLRQNHRVHPEINMNENNSFGEPSKQVRQSEGPHHMRINSQEFYRSAMDRPGSRVAISENSNYGTYGVYSNYNGNLSSGGIRNEGGQFATASRTENLNSDKMIHHYRQLSLRNPQHHRQVSSPAASQSYYLSKQSRPISSYYEYEHAGFLKNRDLNQSIENQRKMASNQMTYHQKANSKNETMYGIIGQQIPNSSPNQPAIASAHPNMPHLSANMIRKQQPIYQSNQVQIYGSIYNTGSNFNGSNQNSRSSLYPSYVRNDIVYNHSNNGLPNTYTTKG